MSRSVRRELQRYGSTTDGDLHRRYTDSHTPRQHASSRSIRCRLDLERVEVLRGPQGVSFGEGAEGGVHPFITVQPSLTNYNRLRK